MQPLLASSVSGSHVTRTDAFSDAKCGHFTHATVHHVLLIEFVVGISLGKLNTRG